MIGIDGVGGPRGPAAPKRRTAREGFTVPDNDPAPPLSGGAAISAPAPAVLDSLLSLQETGTETVRDRAARRHAQDLLDALAVLQRARLAGDLSGSQLGSGSDASVMAGIARLAEADIEADDPRLARVVREVALRARVELLREELTRIRREAVVR